MSGHAVMHVPKAPRQTLQELHRARRIIVSRRVDNQLIELPVETHEDDVVVRPRGLFHSTRDGQEALLFLLGRALGTGAAQESFNFPPRLQHAKLAVRIDLRDQNSLARQDGDETLERKLLQRFPDRCAPDPERRKSLRSRVSSPSCRARGFWSRRDRKSTRLNSSHT